MCRLIQTGDPLYLPITQDPVPKTEDQLEEDAQVMMQLGTDKYASEMRARMMSASLLSDMESFKVCIDFKIWQCIFPQNYRYIFTFIMYNTGGKSWRSIRGLHSVVFSERLDRRGRHRRMGTGERSAFCFHYAYRISGCIYH